MKVTYCEKHNLPSYYTDNNIIHTCAVCNPEIKTKKEVIRKTLSDYAEIASKDIPDNFYDFLLSSKVVINVQCPEWALDSLKYEYELCTNKKLDDNTIGLSHCSAKTRQEKQWYSFSIIFSNEFNTDNLKYNVHTKSSKLNLIYSNELGAFLLKNGLDLGVNISKVEVN